MRRTMTRTVFPNKLWPDRARPGLCEHLSPLTSLRTANVPCLAAPRWLDEVNSAGRPEWARPGGTLSKTVALIALLLVALALALSLVQAHKSHQMHDAPAPSSPPPMTAAPESNGLRAASQGRTASSDRPNDSPRVSAPAASPIPRPTSTASASSAPAAAAAAPALSPRSSTGSPSPAAVRWSGLPPGVPYASDSDPVRIASVRLSSAEVHGGDLASAKVITTSNAAALTARIGTYQVNVPRTAPGTFAISIRVPRLPVVGQTVNIIITAIRTDGMTAQTTVPVKVSF